MTYADQVRLVWSQASELTANGKKGIWSDSTADGDCLGETWEEVASNDRVETAARIAKTFNEAPSHEPKLSLKRYMHDKLHCRMSEDEGQGDWVLFEDISRLLTYLRSLKVGVDISERSAIRIAEILNPLPSSED